MKNEVLYCTVLLAWYDNFNGGWRVEILGGGESFRSFLKKKQNYYSL
jgi:hypothetical protein